MLNSDDIGSGTGEFEGLLRENNINNENNNNSNNNSNSNNNNSNNGGIISNTLNSIGTLINNQIGNRINTITGNNNNNNNSNSDHNNDNENNTNLLSHSYGSNTSSDSEKDKYSINEIGINSNGNSNSNNNGSHHDKKRALYKLDEEDDTNSCNEDGQRVIQPSSSPIASSSSSSPQLQPQSSPQLQSSSSPQPQSSPLFKSSSNGMLINEKKKNKSFIQLEDGGISSNGLIDSDDQDSNNGSIPLHILQGSTIIDDESNIPLSGDSHDNCKGNNHYSAHEEKTHNNYILSPYDKIPPYLQGNEFIASGYRVNFSYKLCFKSIFRFHNETLNIWTHLLGAVLFFILMVYTLSSRLRDDATSVDKFVFAMFFICAQAQMLFSAIFHTFCSVSGKVYLFMARLDYTGISLMIVGSHYPPIYYLFHKCHPNSGIFYLVLISVMGVVGIIVGMIPIFQTYSFRTFRTVFFVVFGLFIVIPLPQIWAQSGISFIWPILSRLMIMGSMYIFGAIIYATRYPEVCCKPGSLDRGLSSHVIWHCFVVAAAVVQFYNCLYAYDNYSGPNSFRCPDDASSVQTTV